MTRFDSPGHMLTAMFSAPPATLTANHALHAVQYTADAGFYTPLAAWYFDNGDMQIHKEMFIITLVLSDNACHRNTGLALLRKLSPRAMVHVVDFINGRKITRKLPLASAAPVGLVGRLSRFLKREAIPVVSCEPVTVSSGLFRNPPRSLRTEIARYLHELESDAPRFDACVVTSRKSLKRLYALNHIKPGLRAQQILFDENPPSDSRLHALRQLSKADCPAEQIQAILAHSISFEFAIPVLPRLTPTVRLALIERMSPRDVLANLPALTTCGAMKNPYLKGRIDRKLEKAAPAHSVTPTASSKPDPNDPGLIEKIRNHPLPRRLPS